LRPCKELLHVHRRVTRDRQYGQAEWNGKVFNLIDTGGFVPRSTDVFESAIRDQVQIAMEEANLLLFLVDATTGLTDLDQEFLQILRRSQNKVVAVVNKVDNHNRLMEAQEFYAMGIDPLFFIAAISGSGGGELLDYISKQIPEEEESKDDSLPRFTIVGQPNVGKSTLVNALLGEERHIVTDIAGTTRDAIDTRYNRFGKEFILVDTAGLRKKAKVHENLEFYSVIRAVKAIDESDVCILLIDAQTGIEGQDLSIFGMAKRKKKGLVILVNKWDLVEKDSQTHLDYERKIHERIAPFTDLPILFVSALEKQRLLKAIDVALEVYENRKRRVSTSALNDLLQEAQARQHAPSVKGKQIKIKYGTQLPAPTPTFAFFCNHPKDVKEAYRNYLENRIRERFNFHGVPIGIHFRAK
jgi:GTP-binding protein